MATHAGANVLARLRGALRDDSERYPGLLHARNEPYSHATVLIGRFVALLFGALIILNPARGVSTREIVGAEALYLVCLGSLALFRTAPDLRVIWASYALCIGSALGLGFTSERGAAAVLLYALAYFIVFRLPLRWSLPALAPDAVLIIMLEGIPSSIARSGFTTGLLTFLITYTLVIFGGFATRSRAFTLKDLRDTQARLRAEMSRNERLAVIRERARIARDMHDVLAHSLTLLSVQTQAARQLVRQDPERASKVLDEMATVLRESAAESRRLVSVLREASVNQNESPLGERLRMLAERFGERSGALISVDEAGAPQPLDEAREEALRFALQEALTNAYRHGAAQHVWVTLRWLPDAVALNVRDDGDAEHAPKSLPGGGNGLRGMRERAEALGGALVSGPRDTSGYEITLTLPLTQAKSVAVQTAQATQAIQEAI